VPFEQVEQAVEADGAAAVGGKVKAVHRNKSSIEQFDKRGARTSGAPWPQRPRGTLRQVLDMKRSSRFKTS
jgi:hypothetical protein